MRTCPHCGGEIRPSVIRCVHCGTSLDAQRPPATAAAGPRHVATATIRPAAIPAYPPITAPDPLRPPAEPDADEDRRPASDPWVTPKDGEARRPAPAAAEMRASPPVRRRLDGRLMGAAVLAIGAAILAVSSLSLSWAQGRLSVVGIRRTQPVAEITFRAWDCYGGPIAIVLAAAMAALGVLWFWHGTDRASHLPAGAHPGIAMIVGFAGWAVIGAATIGSFFWEPAFVERANEAGLTPDAMASILDDRTHRLVELQRLAGLQRFAIAATAAVLAGVVAVWSQRPRRSR